MLLSYANVQFYQELMARARSAIGQGHYADFVDDVKRRYRANDLDDD
jgi:queuine tRNA-ribosyltransferase